MAVRSALFRNFERIIRGDPAEFFRIRLARGDSFDRIASDLRASDDYEVNSETLRGWAIRLGVYTPGGRKSVS